MVEPGTISHGTLLERHLIPTFLSILREHDPENAERLIEDYGQAFIDRCVDGLDYSLVGEMERQSYLLDDLFEALEAIAPDGHYFGAHPGDGSDFGFWPAIAP